MLVASPISTVLLVSSVATAIAGAPLAAVAVICLLALLTEGVLAIP